MDKRVLRLHLGIAGREGALQICEQVFPGTPIGKGADSHLRARFDRTLGDS